MKPLMKIARGALPAFHGRTFDEHVSQWQSVGGAIEQNLWALSAIAASLVTKYGDGRVKEFSQSVGASAPRIYEIAATYRKFENSERSENLSFHHHTIAARSSNPGEVIQLANDRGWSTRELEFYVSTGVEPGSPLALPKASELSKRERAESREPNATAILELTSRLRELTAAHPRFAPELNKLIYRIELQLARPPEKERRVIRMLAGDRILDAEELAAETFLDSVSTQETLDALVERAVLETIDRNGKPIGGKGAGKGWKSRAYYRIARPPGRPADPDAELNSSMVAGPSQHLSQRR